MILKMKKTFNGTGYYSEINIARGILVILVVLGHVLNQTSTDNILFAKLIEILVTVIYSFHMPAFFFVSGFVSLKKLDLAGDGGKFLFIKEKAKRLLVPYFAMGICYLPLRIVMSGMSRTEYSVHDAWRILIGENPDGALWFLYALFLMSVLVCLTVRRSTCLYVFCISVLLYMLSCFVALPLAVFHNFCSNFMFYILGIIVRIHYVQFKKITENVLGNAFMICMFIFCNVILCIYDVEIMRLFTSVAGIYCVMAVSIGISRKDGSIYNKSTNCLGNYSMDIYMFSEPVKVVARTVLKSFPVLFMAVICFLVSLLLPIVISKYVIRRAKVLRVLFLGLKN